MADALRYRVSRFAALNAGGHVGPLPATPPTTPRPSRGRATLEFLKERLTFHPDGAGPFAQFQRSLVSALAQFDRDLIRQRQTEGIAAAKKRGAYKGRPWTLDADKIREI